MNERDKATIEFIRAALRPVLLLLMTFGTYLLIINDIDTEWAQWWMRLNFAGLAEWIVERPIIKAITKKI